MRTMLLFTLALVTGILTSCSTTPHGSFKLKARRITIITEPPGAAVTQVRPLNQPSENLGKTPIEERSVTVMTEMSFENMSLSQTSQLLQHAENVVVRIQKEGFQPYQGTLKTEQGTTMKHEITLLPLQGE